MSKATSTQATRRQLVKLLPIGAAGMLAPTVMLRAPAAASALLAQPTEKGRELLRLIALQKSFMDRSWELEETDETAFDALRDRAYQVFDQIEAFGAEICAQPIRSMSDVIDRTILACWGCMPSNSTDWIGSAEHGQFVDRLLTALLDLGGIAPEACNIARADEAESAAA